MSGSYEELLDRASRAMKEGFTDNALVPATEAAKLAPERWEPRLLLARLWLKMGRADRALSDAVAVMTLSAGKLPHDEMLLAHDAIASANIALGNFAAAEESLRVLDAVPGQAAAGARLVALLLSQEKLAEARTLLSSAAARHAGPHAARFQTAASALIAHDAAHPDVQLSLAELEVGLGLVDSARTRAQKVYAADSANHRAEEVLRAITEGRFVATGSAAGAATARGDSARPGSRFIIFVLLLLIGAASSSGAYLKRDFIESVGREAWPLEVLGGLLMLLAVIGLLAEIRTRALQRV